MNDLVANPFGKAAKKEGTLALAEQSKAVAEIQAAITVAKRFPRDPIQVMDLILQDCTRLALAEKATYNYAKGGSAITGPSIRLLEVVAQRWGNLQCGVKELSRANGASECEAYAWDLESNFKDSKTFSLRHWRDTKQGGYAIKDEREIYEMVANTGARRKRACLEAVIPQEVIDAAVQQCEVTLKTQIDITPERLKSMVDKFSESHGVTKEMIEKRLQRKIDAITPGMFIQLMKIFNSLKDGMGVVSDWFEVTEKEISIEQVKSKKTVQELKAEKEGALPPLSFAQVMDSIIRATSKVEVEEAGKLIARVADKSLHAELEEAELKRRDEFIS